LDRDTEISGDEVSMLRILKRQKRLSITKARDLTGFENERCKFALDNLNKKGYVSFEANQYWITDLGIGYLAFPKPLGKQD